MQQEHRIAVAFLLQTAVRVLHQKGMTIVYRVTQLEGIDGISVAALKLGTQLIGCQAVLIETIIPLDALKDLNFTANEPVTSRHHHLNVRLSCIGGAKLASAALLLAGIVKLWVTQDGQVHTLINQGNGTSTTERVLLLCGGRAHNGHRHVGHATIGHLQAVKVQRLEKFLLAHKSLEWGSPALREDLQPLGGELVNVELGQGSSLGLLGFHLVLGHKKLLWLHTAGSDDALVFKVVEHLADIFGHRLALVTHNQVWVNGLLINTINASEALDQASAGLLVQTLGVTSLADIEGGTNVALDKLETNLIVHLTHAVTVLAEGRDKRGKRDDAAISKELGNLTHTTNVLGTVFRRETQVLVQSSAHVVTVQTIAWNTTSAKLSLQGKAQSGLASTRQAGEPDGAATELDIDAKDFSALGASDIVLDGRDVGGLNHRIRHYGRFVVEQKIKRGSYQKVKKS
eukprot:m.94829 g.94829  ORF g.94829 m.94829 type:complete len:458 (-) comp14741_c0_seq3:54-1427(-)